MPRMSGAASAVYLRLQSGLLMRVCSLVLLDAPSWGLFFCRSRERQPEIEARPGRKKNAIKQLFTRAALIRGQNG